MIRKLIALFIVLISLLSIITVSGDVLLANDEGFITRTLVKVDGEYFCKYPPRDCSVTIIVIG